MGFWEPPGTARSLAEAQGCMTDLFIKHTPPDGKWVLDLGCGVGWPAIRLVEKRGCHVVGITPSRTQAKRAHELAREHAVEGRARFLRGDGMALAFRRGTFDAAWALESLFHVPDRRQVLGEIGRVLRPAGRLILADLVEKRALEPMQRFLMRQFFQVQSLSEVTEYVRLVDQAGFKVKQTRDISENVLPTIPAWKAQIALKRKELARIYGRPFMTLVRHYTRQLEDTYCHRMGYVFIVAEKL